MPRCLAISCYFPPLLLPRSIQVHRTIHGLSEVGWAPTVVCGEPDTLYGNQDSALEGLYPLTYERIQVTAAPLLNPWYMRLCHHIPFTGRSPDRYLPWALRSANTIRRDLNRDDFDAICTFGNPMSVHLAGAILKRSWGLPWVAHFSDPWVDNPYAQHDPLSLWINEKLESSTIESCDAAVFTTDETRSLVLGKYRSNLRTKASVIPHAFDEDLYPRERVQNEKLTLRSVGNFYGPRTPRVLLEAISKLERETPELVRHCRFEFIGTPPDGIERLLEEYAVGSAVRFCPPVGYLESLGRMKEADVLLLIDAPAEVSVFLPSKLVDYLGSGRPILGLTPSRGASAEVIRAIGGKVVPPDNPDKIAAAICQLHDVWNRGELKEGAARSYCRRYTIEETTRQWAEILNRVRALSHRRQP